MNKTSLGSQARDKIKIWKQKLVELETELRFVMQRKGEAASMGDLRENAAYQLAEEDAAVYQVRIDDVRRIIKDLEEQEKAQRNSL